MSGVFYTYVWGHGRQGGPLKFASKSARTVAKRTTQEGDLVFAVVSSNPANPIAQISDALKGRVVNVWQISHITADTADFADFAEAENARDELKDGGYRWPHALQPIRTWVIRDAPKFQELPGYTSSTHTVTAVTSVQEVGDELAATLKDLLATNGEEMQVMTPRSQAMAGRVQQLRQKHPVALTGYAVEPNAEATNSIYIATLGKGSRILKVGHAQHAKQRVSEFNRFRLSKEPQWVLYVDHPIGSVQDAIEVEEFIGETFAKYRTEQNNNEVYIGLDPNVVVATLVKSKGKGSGQRPEPAP